MAKAGIEPATAQWSNAALPTELYKAKDINAQEIYLKTEPANVLSFLSRYTRNVHEQFPKRKWQLLLLLHTPVSLCNWPIYNRQAIAPARLSCALNSYSHATHRIPQQWGARKIVKDWLLGGCCNCIFHPVNRGTSVGFTSQPGKGKDKTERRDSKHKGKRRKCGTVEEMKGIDSGPKGRQNPWSIVHTSANKITPYGGLMIVTEQNTSSI